MADWKHFFEEAVVIIMVAEVTKKIKNKNEKQTKNQSPLAVDQELGYGNKNWAKTWDLAFFLGVLDGLSTKMAHPGV